MKKLVSILLLCGATLIGFTACKGTIVPDYENASDFEEALNDGIDMVGKIVYFEVREIRPDSAFGYNLIAGEHLNFCSTENPGVEVGDGLTIKVTEVRSIFGSYIIYYELV